MIKQQCCARLQSNLGPCTRRAVVERDGCFYCKQHDPEEIEKKYQIRLLKWREDHEIKIELSRRWAAETKACNGVPTETLESISVKELLDGK